MSTRQLTFMTAATRAASRVPAPREELFLVLAYNVNGYWSMRSQTFTTREEAEKHFHGMSPRVWTEGLIVRVPGS